MAWVIIGGLISSLFLTLVVVPVKYSIFDKLINKAKRGKKDQPIAALMTTKYKALAPHGNEFDPAHI